MIGSSERLSRYTPAIIACALANLLLAQFAVAAGLTWPARPVLAPITLAVVHLTTLGWMTLLIFGALFQFVPVISNRPLPSQRLVLAALVAFECGLGVLLAGFIEFATAPGPLLPVGGILVFLAAVLGMADLLPPLASAARRNLSARCVLAGFAALAATLALGVCFALALRVRAAADVLGPLVGGALSAHIIGGLAGGFTLTAVGVSYKLLPMFLLAPEERGALGEAVFLTLAAGVGLGIAGPVLLSYGHAGFAGGLQSAGIVLIALGASLYLIDVVRIYRARRRKAIELHNRAAVGAFAGLALLVPAALLWQGGGVRAPLVVALALVAWLTGLGLTQLYKIVPFLSWLVHFGGKLGAGRVPRVQDLVRESRAMLAFAVFFLGAAVQVAGALLAAAWPFQIGAGLTLLATLALGLEYWRAWRLRYVPPLAAPAPVTATHSR
ncbi:MAG: hypothetical protein ACRET2_01455 [Steroidobacteraceae bacterium]